jgi:hypothetical protein
MSDAFQRGLQKGAIDGGVITSNDPSHQCQFWQQDAASRRLDLRLIGVAFYSAAAASFIFAAFSLTACCPSRGLCLRLILP